MTGSDRERDVVALAALLYEHREDALTCYDHPESYCCVCGEHEVGGYRGHLAAVLAAHDKAVAAKALREAADAVAVMAPPLLTNALTGDQDEPPESEAFRDVWAMLRDRADRIGGAK